MFNMSVGCIVADWVNLLTHECQVGSTHPARRGFFLGQRFRMRLYYYTAKQWGMKSLGEKRLKIAEYAYLND